MKKKKKFKKILFINFYHWKINEKKIIEKKFNKTQVNQFILKCVNFEPCNWCCRHNSHRMIKRHTHNSASVTQIVGQKQCNRKGIRMIYNF